MQELRDLGLEELRFNLAEIRVPSPESEDDKDLSPAAKHFLDFEELYQFDYMSVKVLSLVKSRFYTYDILQYAHDHHINIRINDCSQEAKFVQIASRTARGLDKISRDVDSFSNF